MSSRVQNHVTGRLSLRPPQAESLAHGINNSFVLAPNLTIYNKLIADFTPNTPKYVCKGIGAGRGRIVQEAPRTTIKRHAWALGPRIGPSKPMTCLKTI